MGKTITEKILSKAAGKDVSPGEYIDLSSRLGFTMTFGLLSRGPDMLQEVGATRLFNPNLVHVVDGHNGSTASHNAGEDRSRGRAWFKKMGVPDENIYELGRSGVEHVQAGENAWCVPGEVFFQAVNGHTTTLGALGGFAVTLSFGSWSYLATGKTWARVPESVKIVANGKLPHGVYARDVTEYVLGQIGPSAAVGKVMEWTGPIVDDLSMEGRFTICCNALFFGAWTAIMNPDRKCIDYVKARNPIDFEPLVSDSDAKYCKVYEFDLSHIVPQIVPPPERYHVFPVSQHESKPINRGFIGTCANGRIEDLRVAAQILKGRKIHSDVILNITPGTPAILKQAVQEGLMEIFIDAECAVHYPSCGQCRGANTPLGAGDVCVATATCNYAGRMGSKEAQIYLASPATTAASAIEGKITDPRRYLQGGE
ncbi:MAG: aconitase family protein [Dehalococcoidia bacterium]|nr:aconitase family protein [Dehalococcoidia bacterium]